MNGAVSSPPSIWVLEIRGREWGMDKPLFTPVAGLIQDVLLLSAIFLFVMGLCMVITLRLWDHLIARKRRKALMGRTLPIIQ